MRPVHALFLIFLAINALAEQHTYSISGQLVLETGIPVPNAEITVTLSGWNEVADPVLSDSLGRFSFSGLPAAHFILSAHRNDLGFFYYGQYPQPGIVETIDLNERYPHKDVIFRIERPAIIEGFVRGPEGNALPNVQVFARRRAWVSGKAVTIIDNSAQTDDLGHYRISIGRGRYRICASPLASTETAVPVGYATIGQTPHEIYAEGCQPAGLLDIVPAQKTNVDLTLNAEAPIVVTGTVANVPQYATIWVQLNPMEEGASMQGRFGAVNGETHTFQISNVIPGQYWVTAQVPQNGMGVDTPLVAHQALTVGPSGVSNFEVTLRPVPIVTVLIHAPKGAGVFNVGLRDLSRPQWIPTMAQRQPDGTLQIPLQYPGKYRLATRSDPPTPLCPAAARFGDVDALASSLNIQPGSKETLEVTATDQCGSLKGKVIDEAGKPAPRSRILVLLSGTPDDPGDLLHGSVEEDGSFEDLGLKPGQYSLWAWDELDEWNGAIDDLASMAAWRTVVTIKAGEQTVVDLPQLRAFTKERK